MKKTTAAVLMAIGIAGTGMNIQEYGTRYDSEKIWGRQMTMIERYSRDAGEKSKRADELRSGLGKAPDSREGKCRFEMDFEALTIKRGDAKAAEALIKMQSFEPYAACKQASVADMVGTKWYHVAFPVAFLIGLAGMIHSLVRRKDAGAP
jgi:hypothetical protein